MRAFASEQIKSLCAFRAVGSPVAIATPKTLGHLPRVASASWERSLRILKKISRQTIGWVSITGGDPLDERHQNGVLSLIDALHQRGFKVNIEAAGDTIVPAIFHLSDYLSFDYKTPSTGVTTPQENILQLARNYEGKFQIKSVAQDEDDVLFAYAAWKSISHTLGSPPSFPWSLTPAWERKEAFPQRTISNYSGGESPTWKPLPGHWSAAQMDLWPRETGCLTPI